jgi:hypothetical protein
MGVLPAVLRFCLPRVPPSWVTIGQHRASERKAHQVSGTTEKRVVGKDGESSRLARVFAGHQNGKVRWVGRTVHRSKRTAPKELAELVTGGEHGQRHYRPHPISPGEPIERWRQVGDDPPNPADRATPLSLRRTTVNAPSTSEVQRLLKAGELQGDLVLVTAVALTVVTGCSRRDLCALGWSDLDWQGKALHISRSLTVINAVGALS